MSIAQSLSYLVSSHHGSGTSLLSFHTHPRHRPLDRQWVVMPLMSLLLTQSQEWPAPNLQFLQQLWRSGQVLGDVLPLCTGHLFGTFSMNFLFGDIEDRTRDCQHARWMLYRGVTWTSSVLCDLILQALILSRVILPFILVSIGEPSLRIWCLPIHLPVLSKRKG